MDELNAQLTGESKDKHIFIDFYMQACKWCYYIQDDFNKIETDAISWYGEDKVAFFKIDGNLIPSIARKYHVAHFPYLIYIAPNTNGEMSSAFNANPRNYDTFKKWIIESLKDETPLVPIPGFKEDQQV
jgi:hypothetical protein